MIEPVPPFSIKYSASVAKLLTDPKYFALFKAIDDEYMYWDKVKYKAPEGIKAEDLWQATKLKRLVNPFRIKFGKYLFMFNITPKMLSLLHELDMNIGGNLGAESILPKKDNSQYLVSSIMEEAIASSQMEGATETRKIAKEMLRKRTKPVNKSQQMILNNYSTIRYLVEHKEESFSIDALKNIHKSISTKTLDNPEDEGAFRTDNSVLVMDSVTGEIAHTPPDVKDLPGLLEGLCDFANDNNENPYIHPLVKGIIIHFMLSYFHPFIDGNGRTARSLVYWYLLKSGYWMTEYLSISRVIYKSKAQYEKSFLYTEHDGLDLSYFIIYNLKAMKGAYEDLKKYISKKRKEEEDFYTFKGFTQFNEREAEIIKILQRKPLSYFTVAELATRFNTSKVTARSDLKHMVELGLLQEAPVNKRLISYKIADDFDSRLTNLINK